MSSPTAGRVGLAALTVGDGPRALVEACAQADPSSLAAASALRREFSPGLAALALEQAHLRRRARTKLGADAEHLLLTRDGLEQATRPAVAAWRATRLAGYGVERVVDLGCGLGLDARAFAAAGLHVVAVERDPDTAAAARHNLAGFDAEVIVGDAVDLGADLAAYPHTAVFLDPARRTERGRTWRVDEVSPPWPYVEHWLGSHAPVVVKAGPGLAPEHIPAGVEARWVGEHADTVELSLWHVPGVTPGRAVTLLPGPRDLGPASGRLPAIPIGDVDAFVVEPHGAVLRSGLAGLLTTNPQAPLHALAPGLGYLTGPGPGHPDYTSSFEVLEVLGAGEKDLRRWVREHGVGVLEIKTRGLDLDPAVLRARLRPRGAASATLIVTPTPHGTRALVCRRLAGAS